MTLRVSLIVADLIALVVAWRKAVGMVREASRLNVRLPLGDVLICDGELLSEVPYYVRLTDYCIGIVLFL